MVRRICISIAAAALVGIGVVGTSAPANADSSWGYRMLPVDSHSGIR